MRNILNPPTPAWVARGMAEISRRLPDNGMVYWGPAKREYPATVIHAAIAARMAAIDAALPFERRYAHEHGRLPVVPKTKAARNANGLGLSLDDLG